MSAFPVVGTTEFVFKDQSVKSLDAAIVYNSARSFVLAALDDVKAVHYMSIRRHARVLGIKRTIRSESDNSTTQKVEELEKFDFAGTSLAVQTIHQCFASHQPLSLRPELIWYMIINEVAVHIKQNAERYNSLFNNKMFTKHKLTVNDYVLFYERHNKWRQVIRLYSNQLKDYLGENLSKLFLPQFSTSTISSEIALLVSFMNTSQPYSEYQVVSQCGIPIIKLEGTPKDWELLVEKATGLLSTFPLLSGYFRSLLPVLAEISCSINGSRYNSEFWRSIYKYEGRSNTNVVSGWINALFAHEWGQDGPMLKKQFGWNPSYPTFFTPQTFPSHISQVPFTWLFHGNAIPMYMAAGVFGTWYDKGYLSPRLGFGIFEKK